MPAKVGTLKCDGLGYVNFNFESTGKLSKFRYVNSVPEIFESHMFAQSLH